MDKLIAGFTLQLEKALEIASKFTHSYNNTEINNVLICGLGGSGIGGTIVSNLLSKSASLPITVHKDYNIPAFANERTLMITCSYSGNTEETISAYNKATGQQTNNYVITSGGKLQELALLDQTPHVLIPAGQPPRSCIGYILVQILNILHNNGILNVDLPAETKNAISLLDLEEVNIRKSAQHYASILTGKLPIIYSEANIEGIAIRFRQQLNENSKILCWHHVIPEMNHNELVGWASREEDKIVILLRNSFENERSLIRFDYIKSVISMYCDNILEIPALGHSFLIQCLYLIHMGDWVSYFLAESKKIDPNEVKVIDHLKAALDRN